MDTTELLTEKERLFIMYENAITDETGHIAGRRMLIAKEYKRRYNSDLKSDLAIIRGYIIKKVSKPKTEKKQPVIAPIIAAGNNTGHEPLMKEIERLLNKIDCHEEVMKKQEEKFYLHVLELKKEFNTKYDLLRNQVKYLKEKSLHSSVTFSE